jgi:hypothetical protein
MLCRWVVLRWAQEGKGRTSDLAVRGGLLACWRWSNRWEGRSCQRWHQITTGDIHSQARNVYRNATVSVSLGACVAEIGMWLDGQSIHPSSQSDVLLNSRGIFCIASSQICTYMSCIFLDSAGRQPDHHHVSSLFSPPTATHAQTGVGIARLISRGRSPGLKC